MSSLKNNASDCYKNVNIVNMTNKEVSVKIADLKP